MKSIWKYIAPVGLLVFGACAGDGGLPATALDGDATGTTIGMEFSDTALSTTNNFASNVLKNADGSVTLGDSGVTITSAWINLDEVSLKLPEGLRCESAGFIAGQGVGCEEELESEHGNGPQVEAEAKIAGPFAFDLISGTSEPDIGEITIPSGVYRKVKLKLEESELPGQMQNRTLVAAGTIVDAEGASHPFQLRLKFSEELLVDKEEGVQVGEGIQNQIMIQLGAEEWMTDVPLRACLQQGHLSLNGDGDLVIDEETEGSGSCENVAERIRENIRNSFEMQHRERERNGEDDDGEDDDS